MTKELRRGRVMPCTSCGAKGATIGCNAHGCHVNVHLPCAVKGEGWRMPVPWLREGNPFLCSRHAQVRFKKHHAKLIPNFLLLSPTVPCSHCLN